MTNTLIILIYLSDYFMTIWGHCSNSKLSHDQLKELFPFDYDLNYELEYRNNEAVDSVATIENNFSFNVCDRNGQELYMLHTQIKYLRKDDLKKWKNLTALTIKHNDHLIDIEPAIFQHMRTLKNLTISENYALTRLHPNIFDGLINLVELHLTGNRLITNILEFTVACRPSILPNLKLLDIGQNIFGDTLNVTAFIAMNGSKLESLFMVNTGLNFIDGFAFTGFKYLNWLDLSENALSFSSWYKFYEQYIESGSQALRRIGARRQYLSAYEFLCTKSASQVHGMIGRTNITYLDLGGNNFGEIIPNFFPDMPKITTLDLSYCCLSSIYKNGISFKNFPKLKTLLLNGNSLSSDLDTLEIPNLEKLDLSNNLWFANFNFLKNMFRFKKLKTLNLSKNNIFHIFPEMFQGLNNLENLYLKNCTISRIEEFALIYFHSLKYLDLSQNPLISLKRDNFAGLNNLIALDLSYCQIGNFSDLDIFLHISRLEYLNLRYNVIGHLNQLMFSNLVCLKRLDLSYNDIYYWTTPLFLYNPSLRHLTLKGNHITDFYNGMLTDFSNLKFLDLQDNPIQCHCAFAKIIQLFLLFNNHSINDLRLNKTNNYCANPPEYTNKTIVEYVEDMSKSKECDEWKIALIILISMPIIIILGTTCTFIGYYMRWHIRYWIFLLRQAMGYKHFPMKKKNSIHKDFDYDAFISYSNEDRNFVLRLVAMLERHKPYFNLCVYERDFLVGDVICDTVVNSVAASRHVVIILSESYVKSHWCLWEMNIVRHKRIFFTDCEGSGPLIIIKYGEINEDFISPTLKYLMKTRIYLEWHEDAKRQLEFWDKIRAALLSTNIQQ